MKPFARHVAFGVVTLFMIVIVTLPIVLLFHALTASAPSVGTDTISSSTPTVSVQGNTFHSGRKLSEDTVSLAKADSTSAYSAVESRGGSFISLDDGNTYGVWWQPTGFDVNTDTVVVSLGGHAGWATKDFDVWYPEISSRHYAFFSLQWWLGKSLETNGYYEPTEMYDMIRQVLVQKGVPAGHVIFQAYSMASARSYIITALDRGAGHYFGVTIANSGVWESDYTPNAPMIDGAFGNQPLEGTRFILYCAVHDEEHPDWNSCQAMDETESVIMTYGGTIDLYIKDQTGSHGSFMVNRENVRAALDVADGIISGS